MSWESSHIVYKLILFQETTQGGLAIPALRVFYQFLIVSTVTRFKSTGWIYLSHSLPLSFCHSGEIQGGQWQDLRRSAWLCCWSPPGDQSIVKWSWNEWRFSQTWFLNYLPLSNCLHFVLSHRWPPRRTQAIHAKLLKTLFSSNRKKYLHGFHWNCWKLRRNQIVNGERMGRRRNLKRN